MKYILALIVVHSSLYAKAQESTWQFWRLDKDTVLYKHKVSLGTTIFPFHPKSVKENVNETVNFYWVEYDYNVNNNWQFGVGIAYNYFKTSSTFYPPPLSNEVNFRSRELTIGAKRQIVQYKNLANLGLVSNLVWSERTSDTSRIGPLFERGDFWTNAFYLSMGVSLEIWPHPRFSLSTDWHVGKGFESGVSRSTVTYPYPTTYITRSPYYSFSMIITRDFSLRLKYRF